ncbi:MAG TPA: Stp1/IreP family PP2C-type Ser/Thr phosphatase [Gaiellaceae bacterium]|nr:Stp1/IreP family PP2C-type Ser/Thr phosphatase [Gaiellaceae bacterium]
MSIGAFTAATDTGRRRRRNEDAYVVAPPLFAVADGMGGAQAGEVASRLAAAVLSDTDAGSLTGTERVTSLFQEANRRVYERSAADPAVSGMGTTMTVALVEADEVVIGHVGDSRAYLLRDGRLEQLTDDHSLVAELLKSGQLSAEEAETHPQRAVITRALGTDPDVDVDAFAVHARPGDVFLICSDGLTTMLDDDEILALLQRYHDDLPRAAKALVAAANRSGGEDNITVVAFEIAPDEPSDDLGDTVAMPAFDSELDDTIAGAPSPAADAADAALTEPPTARLRLALTMAGLLALAGLLLLWGLLR